MATRVCTCGAVYDRRDTGTIRTRGTITCEVCGNVLETLHAAWMPDYRLLSAHSGWPNRAKVRDTSVKASHFFLGVTLFGFVLLASALFASAIL